MFTALLILQVLLGVAIIGLVLLQQGKGADMGAAFGAGASGTVFGARGSGSFLSRTTGILAALFFANSVLLSSPVVLGNRHSRDNSIAVQLQEAPKKTATPPAEGAPAKPGEGTVDMPPADLPEVDTKSKAGSETASKAEQKSAAPAAESKEPASKPTSKAGDTTKAASPDAAPKDSGTK